MTCNNNNDNFPYFWEKINPTIYHTILLIAGFLRDLNLFTSFQSYFHGSITLKNHIPKDIDLIIVCNDKVKTIFQRMFIKLQKEVPIQLDVIYFNRVEFSKALENPNHLLNTNKSIIEISLN